MKTFKGKVVVITGAGSGIGRALAQNFAAQGAMLALNDMNDTALKETVNAFKNDTEVLQEVFDVSDKDTVFSFAKKVIATYGHIDILINNAGVGLGDYTFEEVDLQLFEKVMQINFNGVFYGCKAFIPELVKRPESALVNISSVFGLTGIARSAAYCASKFAVHGLTQSLMQEYADTGLNVISVHPGGVDTNITVNAIDYDTRTDKSAFLKFQKEFLKMQPDKAAKLIMHGIQRKKRKILIGHEAYQLDLVTRLFPYYGGRIVNKTLAKKLDLIQKSKPQI